MSSSDEECNYNTSQIKEKVDRAVAFISEKKFAKAEKLIFDAENSLAKKELRSMPRNLLEPALLVYLYIFEIHVISMQIILESSKFLQRIHIKSK